MTPRNRRVLRLTRMKIQPARAHGVFLRDQAPPTGELYATPGGLRVVSRGLALIISMAHRLPFHSIATIESLRWG